MKTIKNILVILSMLVIGIGASSCRYFKTEKMVCDYEKLADELVEADRKLDTPKVRQLVNKVDELKVEYEEIEYDDLNDKQRERFDKAVETIVNTMVGHFQQYYYNNSPLRSLDGIF